MEFILSITFKFINYEKQRYMKPLCENGNLYLPPHNYKFSKNYF